VKRNLADIFSIASFFQISLAITIAVGTLSATVDYLS
jgi:hypothetical protein